MTCKRKTALASKRSIAGLLVTALIGSLAFQISAISEAGAWTSEFGAVSAVTHSRDGIKNNKLLPQSWTNESAVDTEGNIYTVSRFDRGPIDVDTTDKAPPHTVGKQTNAGAVIQKLDANGKTIWSFPLLVKRGIDPNLSLIHI